MPETPEVSVQQASAALQAGAVLIDVREPHEHAERRIAGARLLPLGTVPQRLAEIPADVEVLIHCEMGGRSARAVDYLVAQGRTNVVNVGGGIAAWAAAGLPVEEGPATAA